VSADLGFYLRPDDFEPEPCSVEGRKPFRVSASQINTFCDCPRKWGLEKLDKISGPPSPHAAFGSRVHKQLEEWFEDGTPPDDSSEGRVAFSILQHLPVPQTEHLDVERQIDLLVAGAPLIGYVDLSILAGREVPFVSDHKTTGSIPNPWMLTPERMPGDTQCALYALDAMLRTNSTEVELQWTYGTRDGRKSLPVVKRVTLDEIRPKLLAIRETVEEMREIYENHIDTALDLPYNAASCEKYGGCYFNTPEFCNLSPRERMQSIMTQTNTKSAFLAKLRGKKNKGGESAPAGATTHPPPAEPVEEPKGTTTTKGTVNPPSAPDEAAANPEEAEAAKKPQRKKKASKRRPKKDDAPAADPKPEAAAKPAEKAPPAAKVSTPTPPAPKPAAGATAGMVPLSQVTDLVDHLVAKYREGFRDGFNAAKGQG